MKRTRTLLLLALCTTFGFALGLAFEGIIGKAYAKTETPLLTAWWKMSKTGFA